LQPMRVNLRVAPFMFVLAIIALPCAAQEHVVIKGKGIVPSHLKTPLNLTMVVGDSVCVWVELKGRGRFEIESVEDQRYLLRFEQIGSMTKTIQVDTRFAERKIGSHERTIAFDVMMEPTEMIGRRLRYAGPVGRIAFHRSNGRMEVAKDYSLDMPSVVEVREEP
ncbi:MAG TPA: hypothetical protein VKG92_10395, partial [Flavobacteriales bacterium]|nr:hypothetical protein [Flavobacteriales bacterium]